MPEPIPSPLYDLLNQINGAAQSGLHLVAIAMASALPDICASLASDDGRTNAEKYKNWCDENLAGEEFSFVTAKDLYSFRCGVLHQGRFGDLAHDVARVVFVPPNPVMMLQNGRIGDAYAYSVIEFCKNMCDAAFRWYEANREAPNVKVNSDRLMRYHPQGLAPYVVGLAVIA